MRARASFPPTAETRYRDRLEAGAALARLLEGYRGQRPVVLGIPRGGVPVGSTEACAALAGEADEVVCPSRPEPFIAIGLHYLDFEQVDDSEVVALLKAAGRS